MWGNKMLFPRHGPLSTEGCQPVLASAFAEKNTFATCSHHCNDFKNQTIILFLRHFNDVLWLFFKQKHFFRTISGHTRNHVEIGTFIVSPKTKPFRKGPFNSGKPWRLETVEKRCGWWFRCCWLSLGCSKQRVLDVASMAGWEKVDTPEV